MEFAALGIGALLGTIWIHSQLSASLPQLNGTHTLQGIQQAVLIERDALGVPTIHGQNRQDVARATGFIHAQERFFQMDLLRRQAAGELAELVGKAAIPMDRKHRIHRFRMRAQQVLATCDTELANLLAAYAQGVNAGLKALGNKPFEYLALFTEPEEWLAEDTFLVLYAMFIDLQRGDGSWDSHLGVLRDTLPPALTDFLTPLSTEWDTLLTGEEPVSKHPIPPPELFTLRQGHSKATDKSGLFADQEAMPVGSNNWAVAGQRTASGAPLLAGDMHLTHRVPNIWYRASMKWQQQGQTLQVTGVTLPGAPFVIAGSNGFVAWSFTNSYGDWSDLIELQLADTDTDAYLTSQGAEKFVNRKEIIRVKDGPDQELNIRETKWGPVLDQDHRGRLRALRWLAYQAESINLNIHQLEQVRDIAHALDVANRSGLPPQNFVAIDKNGHIGWTIAGVIPKRGQVDTRFPITWRQAEEAWQGWLSPADYPRLIDPPAGIIWTANSRVLGEEWMTKLGDGGLRLGARGQQIRNNLLAIEQAAPQDMLAIQLDDRAIFLKRWQTLLLNVLTDQTIAGQPRRAEFRQLVLGWSGRASTDSVGYRLVHDFRLAVARRVFSDLTQTSKQADERFGYLWYGQWEGPLWTLVSERPLHMLGPTYQNWQELFVTAIDEVVSAIEQQGLTLEQATWGQANTLQMRHPLSLAVPTLSKWLDARKDQLSGDHNMPRVQSPTAGASQRMVVSPGREEEGFFHMPGGQSGHPLSPFYKAGHEAWVKGLPTPFLPGATRHVLVLEKENNKSIESD